MTSPSQKHLPSLDVLISTCNERIAKVVDMNLQVIPGVSYVISHQRFEEVDPSVIKAAEDFCAYRDDVTLITIQSKGAGANRNNALDSATADLCLITDDDVVFDASAIQQIQHLYQDHPDLDFIAFRMVDKEHRSIKNYPESDLPLRPIGKRHESASIWGPEISFRRKAVLENGIRFNELIGVGSNLPVGEDTLFAVHCFEHGLRMAFSDLVILQCPNFHTNLKEDPRTWTARGVVWPRVFGFGPGFLMIFLRLLALLFQAGPVKPIYPGFLFTKGVFAYCFKYRKLL